MRKPDVTIPAENPPADLVIEDVTVGDGDEAAAGQAGSTCTTSACRGRPASSSMRRGDRMEPFSFGLGQGQVIQGWDQGVAG